MWAPLCGKWHSSGRAELAALVMAAHARIPIHIGLDNRGVVNKANFILQMAGRHGNGSGEQLSRPYKMPWGLQVDGELWKTLWDLVWERGPKTTRVSKVKGHATSKMVAEGKVCA